MFQLRNPTFDPKVIEKLYFESNLSGYIRAAWEQVEPAITYMHNWHIDAISEHLEAVTKSDIRRLVINIPPGAMKSLTCSVFWPTWVWTHTPSAKFITASFSENIAQRDSYRARRLMESEWYQGMWSDVWQPNQGQWTKKRYLNDQGGLRIATTVGGQITGDHANHQLVDDPIKPLDADNRKVETAALVECIAWYDETLATRVADPKTATRTIIMQRLHEKDLSGYVLAKELGYDHLCLPMKYEPKCVIDMGHRCSLDSETSLGFTDPRTEKDELLWPERFPEEVQIERLKELGARGVAAQDQQRPTPAGGGLFKRDFVKYWKVFPTPPYRMILSWDCSFKDLDSSDWVVGQCWVAKGGSYYLIDRIKEKLGFSGTCAAIRSFRSKWKKTGAILIEDKANGPAVIEVLQKDIAGIIPVNPKGGKWVRAQAVEPLWASGSVYIPDPSIASWVEDFIKELISFSGMDGQTDDQVDAMTQALTYLHEKSTNAYAQAMRNVF